ncbi:MAG: hypothetical protein ALAOOOJD_02986 [bacterium]|nr:hypothetical protein [bacterium]
MDPQIIPAVDPIPLPAPFWLFKLLLVVTFILHILVMNFMLGGGVLAAIAKFKSRKDENYRRLFEDLSKKIPSLLAATVTLGVAPLLFLQVLYGQFFYSSSVLIGWPWFLVLIFLALAYYGFYLVAFKKGAATNKVGWVFLFSMILVFVIGFLYSNNMTLLLTPEQWAAKYHADPSGWNLNWGEQTLIPRFLHFFIAALAVGGLFIATVGLFRWKQDTEYARFLIKFGSRWFMYVTMLEIVAGLWFLISLPRAKMMLFMGENLLATIALLIGVVGALAAIFLMSEALRKADPRKGFYLASGLTVGVIIFMAIMREVLRDAYLANYFNAKNFVVQTQWDVLILFLALFVGGVALWFVMIKRYFFSPKAAS